jgi:hypothetical protein
MFALNVIGIVLLAVTVLSGGVLVYRAQQLEREIDAERQSRAEELSSAAGSDEEEISGEMSEPEEAST